MEVFLFGLLVSLLWVLSQLEEYFLFEKKPYHHYRNTSGWNPDDHSSGTSGDSSGTSGEGEIFYDEQYDKSDASIYSAYRKPKDKKPK